MHNLCCCPPDKPVPGEFSLSLTSCHKPESFKEFSTIKSNSSLDDESPHLDSYSIPLQKENLHQIIAPNGAMPYTRSPPWLLGPVHFRQKHSLREAYLEKKTLCMLLTLQANP